MSKVFISYVREDQNKVDLLAAELRREGIQVWLDRDDIRPGHFWEEELRDAIADGAYFLACFSKAFHTRDSTYMHKELQIACKQSLSQALSPGWLIPVLLSPCEIPTLPVSEDRTLRDVQWIDLSKDWNTGIWKLLQVIRPPSTHTIALDEWFRQLCKHHIESNIDRNWSMGAFRVRQIEDAWRSLLLPSRWTPTLDIIVHLFEKTKERNAPLTERWVEPSSTGITIVITISPTASVNTILQSLSPSTSETESPYENFIRNERKILHNLVNWPDRDFVHWVFALDGEDLTADLLYWPNLRLMLQIHGIRSKSRSEGNNTGPIEFALPGSLQTVTELEKTYHSITREEVFLLKDNDHAEH